MSDTYPATKAMFGKNPDKQIPKGLFDGIFKRTGKVNTFYQCMGK